LEVFSLEELQVSSASSFNVPSTGSTEREVLKRSRRTSFELEKRKIDIQVTEAEVGGRTQ
jgi:hypothetical protein